MDVRKRGSGALFEGDFLSVLASTLLVSGCRADSQSARNELKVSARSAISGGDFKFAPSPIAAPLKRPADRKAQLARCAI